MVLLTPVYFCACALSAKMSAPVAKKHSEYTLSPSFIRGYHIYKDTWTPTIGEELNCEVEPNNKFDKYAVCVKNDSHIVGHMPREISRICTFFLKRGGRIIARITGQRVNRGLTLGLEVPAIFIFRGPQEDINNLPKLLLKK